MQEKQPDRTPRSNARSHRQGRDWPLSRGSETNTTERRCDHPECGEAGLHRAPRSRDDLRSWYWFCLDHVREYNKAWNFYAGMSDAEVEAERRKDTFWHRPTWPLGKNTAPADDVHDPFDMFGDPEGTPRGDGAAHAAFREQSPELAALALMDLKPPVNVQRLKSRYKELVKKYHPDANGGDRQAEERLKDINQAYATLMRSLGAGNGPAA